MKAIKLDFFLEVFGNKTLNPERYDTNVKSRLNNLYELLDKIEPLSDDEYKVIYFCVERGNIE